VPRPPGRESPPAIPEREIDPITDGLRLLTYTQLVEMLQKARRIAAGSGNTSHLRELSLEQIPCLESEMIRRGMDVPPVEPVKEDKRKKSGKKK
jgi:hypothetical protein